MSAATESRQRHLGLTTLVCLVVANMIGAGVFTTSGYALADLGTPGRVLLAWAVGGGVALLGALSYGALAMRLSESGGEYLFLSRTLHPLLGFLAGWISLWAGFTGATALAAETLQVYVEPWVGDGSDVVGSAAIVLAGLLHTGRRRGAILHNSAVAVKLLLILVFFALGLTGLPSAAANAERPLPEPSLPGPFPLGAFAVTLMWVSLSYSGWNAAVYVGGEARDPRRSLPRSMLYGTLLVMALYLGLNALFVYAAPVSELAGVQDIGAASARALGGEGLAGLVRVIIALALFTSISGMVLAGPRVYARMADDAVFPRMFAFGERVPTAAIWLQVLLALVVLWISELRELLSYLGFLLAMSTALTVVGLIALRRREGVERVPVTGWPWVPVLFVALVVATGALMIFEREQEPLVALATVAIGALVWLACRRPSGR